MAGFDLDYIYTLYNDDDGVVVYDSLADAEEIRDYLREILPVFGPYQHSRIEKPVILAAQRVLDVCRPAADASDQQAQALRELERALEAMLTRTQAAWHVPSEPDGTHQ